MRRAGEPGGLHEGVLDFSSAWKNLGGKTLARKRVPVSYLFSFSLRQNANGRQNPGKRAGKG